MTEFELETYEKIMVEWTAETKAQTPKLVFPLGTLENIEPSGKSGFVVIVLEERH